MSTASTPAGTQHPADPTPPTSPAGPARERPRAGTQFRALLRALTKGFFRDRTTLFFTFFFPLMFLVIFGLLLGGVATSATKVGVVGSGQVVGHLPPDAIEAKHYATWEEGVRAVQKGDVPLVVREQGGTLDVRYSAADRVKSGVALGIVNSIVDRANVMATRAPPAYTLRAEQVESKELKPIQYMTPGILSWGVATSATFGAAMSLVAWRKSRLLRRLRLAPVGVGSIAAARVTLSVFVAIVQALLFVAIAMTPPFGLKLAGTAWLALPLLLVGTLAFLAVGLLVGALTKTEEAASAVANFVVLPMAFLSGTFFPLDDAPGWLRTVGNLLPLKHLNEAMIGVLARGQGAGSLVAPIGILLAFTVVVTAIALRFFSWGESD